MGKREWLAMRFKHVQSFIPEDDEEEYAVIRDVTRHEDEADSDESTADAKTHETNILVDDDDDDASTCGFETGQDM